MSAEVGDVREGPSVGTATAAGRSTMEVRGASVVFGASRRHGGGLKAVDDVTFSLPPGSAVGLVGASGSGKSTAARMLLGLIKPTSGSVTYGDVEVSSLRGRKLKAYHRRVQMVFQDPYAALNPVHTVEYAVSRPLRNFSRVSAAQATGTAHELLETVGLFPTAQFASKLPHQLSGGQRQRVVIARALACDPEFVVADEPVSMLDVSMRAGVLGLLAKLRAERGLTLLYITHDLLSARVVTDTIMVMHEGQIVESGPTKDVLQNPTDDYTRLLLDAVANPFAADRGSGAAPERHASTRSAERSESE